ncbi:predicted transcriptional regulators [Corynebacterium glutamicum]|nr:predicted transcriptional regulators [Corynebacterium glutamicum]
MSSGARYIPARLAWLASRISPASPSSIREPPSFMINTTAPKPSLSPSFALPPDATPLDTKLSDLIGELAARSTDFTARWGKHNVLRHSQGQKTFHHPGVGTLELIYTDLTLLGDPTVSMTTYTAVPGSPTADSLALLGTWAQSQEEL